MLRKQSSSNRPDSTEKKLLSYALVAGAGVIASSHPAQASILHSGPLNLDFTNTNFTIDFNGDSIDDFLFTMPASSNPAVSNPGFSTPFGGTSGGTFTPANAYRALNVAGAGANQVMGFGGVAALSTSNTVTASGNFVNGGLMASGRTQGYAPNGTNGPFANAGPKFLGLKFDISGNMHFGWARFDVSVENFGFNTVNITAQLVDYAYETTPNTSIHIGSTSSLPSGAVPEPGSLGMLALGAAGLAALRLRRRRSA